MKNWRELGTFILSSVPSCSAAPLTDEDGKRHKQWLPRESQHQVLAPAFPLELTWPRAWVFPEGFLVFSAPNS